MTVAENVFYSKTELKKVENARGALLVSLIEKCFVCKIKNVMGQGCCLECGNKCQESTGHLLIQKYVVDNNWDMMECIYCHFNEKSQCKDPRTKDGFEPK